MIQESADVTAQIASALAQQTQAFDRNIVIVVGTMVAGVFTSLITLWKGAADQKHALAMIREQHLAAMDDRDRKFKEAREERLSLAQADRMAQADRANELQDTARREHDSVRQRLDNTERGVREALTAETQKVRDKLSDTEADVRERLSQAAASAAVGLGNQTADIRMAIKDAQQHTSDKADAAYKEANSVNSKIEKLSAALLEVVRGQARVNARAPVPVEVTKDGK